ncbi:MAG: hypothetical protein Q4E13_13125 [Clostridia bacterium]|nr:hypothetical protein [Clostridia bacterium]
MLIRLLKLPVKLAALPMIPVLLALHFAGTIVLGLSSVITNLLATVFLLGSLAGWIVHAPDAMLCQTVGIGIFFALAPHIVGWLLGIVTDVTIFILDFVLN